MKTIPDGTPLLIGLGCSSSATSDEIVSLVSACLAETRREPRDIAALASHVRRRNSQALREAASHYRVPLRFLDDAALALGVPGTCEAVAATAGPLLLGKRKSRHATCAIAACAPGYFLSGVDQPESSSAAMASSRLATSLAAP